MTLSNSKLCDIDPSYPAFLVLLKLCTAKCSLGLSSQDFITVLSCSGAN